MSDLAAPNARATTELYGRARRARIHAAQLIADAAEAQWRARRLCEQSRLGRNGLPPGQLAWEPVVQTRRGHRPTTMQVAGVDLSLGSVAELARCLDRAGHWEAAMHVGFAVDRNLRQLALTVSERELISMLEQCPASLLPLLDALERRA